MMSGVMVALATAVQKAKELVRYGRVEEGGLWYLHFTNTTKRDKKGDFPLHGRITAWFGGDGRTSLRFAWALGDSFAQVGASVDEYEPEVCVFAALPPVALWLTLESWPLLRDRLKGIGEREVRIAVHDAALWWNLWTKTNEWTSKTPRWRQGGFYVLDELLGRAKVECTPLGAPVPVVVPMPEGSYEGTVQLELVKVERPRWFSKYGRQAHIEMRQPIPVPGKGENSWDCDEDAIYSQSCPARTVAEAIASIFESAMSDRERRAGLNWKPEGKKGGTDDGGDGGEKTTAREARAARAEQSDDPLCEICDEPVPSGPSRLFDSEDSVYAHASCVSKSESPARAGDSGAEEQAQTAVDPAQIAQPFLAVPADAIPFLA